MIENPSVRNSIDSIIYCVVLGSECVCVCGLINYRRLPVEMCQTTETDILSICPPACV